MAMGRNFLTCAFAGVVGSMLLAPTTATAQDGPNTGNISLSGGADIVTEYWFRGIAQENQGFILQPYLDVSADVTDNTYVYFGTWNSLHYDSPSDGFFESDWYFGGGVNIDKLNIDLNYTNLYNPDGGSSFAEEINLAFAYDDSDFWSRVGLDAMPALNPHLAFAFEVDGGSDGMDDMGGSEGVYGEIGIEPSFRVLHSETYPVDLAVPVVAGFDVDNDYYENAAGEDSTFGFIDVGLVASMPLDEFVPADYGAWHVHAGVHLIALGDAADEVGDAGGVSGDSDASVYGSFGIGFDY